MNSGRPSPRASHLGFLPFLLFSTACSSIVIDTREDGSAGATDSGPVSASGGASSSGDAAASGGSSIEAGMDAADAALARVDSGGADASDGHALVIDRLTSVVGAEGGALAVGELSLTIPEGALAAATTISIARIPRGALPSTVLHGIAVYSDVYRFEPSGLRFLKPVRVAFNLYPAATAGPPEATTFVFWSEASMTQPTTDAYAPATKLDGVAHSGRVTHLSSGFLGSARRR